MDYRFRKLDSHNMKTLKQAVKWAAYGTVHGTVYNAVYERISGFGD